MKTTSIFSLLAVAFAVVLSTDADAQLKTHNSKVTAKIAKRSKLMHFNAKQGIVDVACAAKISKIVNLSDRAVLTGIVQDLKAGKTKEADSQWSQFAEGYVKKVARTENRKPTSADVESLIQSILRESYLESNKDLQFYADKVKHFNDQKESIRNEMTRLRKMHNSMSADARVLIEKAGVDQKRATRNARITRSKGTWMSRDELDVYIKELEQSLSSTGEDAQLANIDLQNSLQKQQQVMQTMSNVSKMMHDTAMAIIRKIG